MMNAKLTILYLVLCLCCTFSAKAVVMISTSTVDTATVSTQQVIIPVTATKTSVKKEQKITKLFQRTVGRILKKNNSYGNVLSSRKFRLGALLLLVGILGGVMVNIFTLLQVFGWLAGVIAVVGLVLMVWSLIEHS